ncbi:MAG TPA: RraA family protein [Candidatus Acidoferrum sp.]|nr:RraA family protein [Candidatus Acidoferrum sp.]
MSATANDFVERLKRLDCCAVSDALDKLGLAGAVTGIAQLSTSRRIAGRILTVKLGVGELPAGKPRHVSTTAIEAAQPGDIIVVEQHSGVNAASWGGILTLGAKLRGVAGAIADGPVRDIDESRQLDFPVFGTSVTTLTARGRIVELATGEPIKIRGVQVRPGDYVIADGSGVVFIAAENIERVLAAAEDIFAREAAMAQALREGKRITEVMGANYENMLKT